jgi:hypothetical protein
MDTLDDARTLISNTTADNAFEHQELYLALRTLPPKERSAITLLMSFGIMNILSNVQDILAIRHNWSKAVRQ